MGAGNQIAIIFGFKEAAQCFLIQYQSFRFFGHWDPPLTGLILACLLPSSNPNRVVPNLQLQRSMRIQAITELPEYGNRYWSKF